VKPGAGPRRAEPSRSEERLNADLKQPMGKRVPVRTRAKLLEVANGHMAMLEQNPQRVISHFRSPA
jgi:hypothetical protein